MQPWRFIVVSDVALRTAVYEIFLQANAEAAATYTGERGELYSRVRLEGLLDSPQHLCVVCDPTTPRGHRLGRNSMPEHLWYAQRRSDLLSFFKLAWSPFAAGRPVIRALGILKKCSALVNGELRQLPIFKV